MKWIDYRKKFEEGNPTEKLMMLETGAYTDMDILRRFLLPENYEMYSKEDLWDALAVVAAIYCDHHEDLMNLERTIEERFGTKICDEVCEASVSAILTSRVDNILEKATTKERADLAIEYINEISDYHDPIGDDEE